MMPPSSGKGFAMTIRFALIPFALAALAGPASAQPWAGETGLEDALEGRTPGRPTQCLAISRVRSSTIVDGTAILFRVGNTIYVNRPRAGAGRLDNDDMIVNRTAAMRLCRGDPVRTRDPHTGTFRGAIILGAFVPYRRGD